MNLYVGNISYNMSDEDLTQIFEQFGEVVRVHIVKDRETNRSKGFAFVEMGSDAAGDAAVEGLNNTQVNGRTIRVNKAHPRENRPARQNNARAFS